MANLGNLVTLFAVQSLNIFLFRSIPFVAYAVLDLKVRWPTRVLALIGLATLVGGLQLAGQAAIATALRASIELAYFAIAVVAIFALRQHPLLRDRLWMTVGASFALFMLIPGLAAPPVFGFEVVVIGWEMLFACISVSAHDDRSETSVDLASHLRFILVNPILVYADRGQRTSAIPVARCVFRCILGISAIVLQLVLGYVLVRSPAPFETWFDPAGVWFLQYYALGLTVYFAHSGLASMQIGWMGLLGYQIPERYHYPILARSPQDFWQRWNIWLGHWARRYLFTPIAMVLGRAAPRSMRRAAIGLAAVVTFVAIGVLHDVAAYVGRFRAGAQWNFGFTVLFLFFGVTYVGQIASKQLLGASKRPWRKLGAATWKPVASIQGIVNWLTFNAYLAFVAWLALPVLTGQGPPDSLPWQ